MPNKRVTHCTKCGCRRTRKTFWGTRGGTCKHCRNARRRERRRLHTHVRERNARQCQSFRLRRWAKVLELTCRRHDAKSTLTERDILDLYAQQKGRCRWFNVVLSPSSTARHPAKPSVDRLDRSKPHSRENCVLASFAANIGRNSTSLRDWKKFLRQMRRVI